MPLTMHAEAHGEESQAATPATAFARLFAEAWAIGATDPERFFAHFATSFAPDVRLVQPLVPAATGLHGFRRRFEPIFAAIPDLRAEVLRYGATADGVLIELTLRGTVAGRELSWNATDRFTMKDGLVVERRSYFDPLPVIAAVLRRPRGAARMAATLLTTRRRP